MGILDGAADGLKLRLEIVGVPAPIAFALGQVAYIAPRKRARELPPAVATKSEVTWLVSEYENELRQHRDEHARMALIQGLCTRVFGQRGPEVFELGYPAETLPQADKSAQRTGGQVRRFSEVHFGVPDEVSIEDLDRLMARADESVKRTAIELGYTPVENLEDAMGEVLTASEAKRHGLAESHWQLNFLPDDTWVCIAQVDAVK